MNSEKCDCFSGG